jgi:hypothetical protein
MGGYTLGYTHITDKQSEEETEETWEGDEDDIGTMQYVTAVRYRVTVKRILNPKP